MCRCANKTICDDVGKDIASWGELLSLGGGVKISVILATYNRPHYLRLSLSSVLEQEKAGSYEVVVADDGSGEQTAQLVSDLAGKSSVEVVHAWHEDRGFRLAAIRNVAVARASGDYLIFMDDDCVAPVDFLHRFRKLIRQGEVIAGERVNLSEPFTAQVLTEARSLSRLSKREWFQLGRQKAVDRPSRMIVRLPDGPHRLAQRDNWSAVEGCNFGVGLEDYRSVNGFDETFSGWGYEDWDIAHRLWLNGLRIRDGRFLLGVTHLWHKESDKSKVAENLARFEDRKSRRIIRAVQGLDQHGGGR